MEIRFAFGSLVLASAPLLSTPALAMPIAVTALGILG